MATIRINDRVVPWVFFLAVALIYVSLSPLSVEGMGYASENLATTEQIVSWLANRATRREVSIDWPRHGFVEPLLGVPFVLCGRLLGGPSPTSEGALYSLLPVLCTALLCTVVFAWVSDVAGSRTRGLALATTAAFGTTLWPYAYIGLETTQSLFIMLAGYLALRAQRSRSWLACLGFGLVAGLALSAKQNGVFLVPAVAFLVYRYFRRDGTAPLGGWREEWPRVAAVVVLIGVCFWLAVRTRGQYWGSRGGGFLTFTTMGYLEDEPLMMAFATWSTFFSINKGLFIFVPVTILCLAACWRARRANAGTVIFALLVLLPTVGALSLLVSWSDELWGPRYLHCAVAPLIVCHGIAWKGTSFRLRQEAGWLALAATGAAISFLGVFFYYGQLYGAATRTSSSTLEAYQYDPNFNHIRFNLRLLGIWSRGPSETVERWPPARFWVWSGPPANRERIPRVDLRRFAVPQPILARGWGASAPAWHGRDPLLVKVLATCLGLGLGLGVWIALGVWAADRDGRSAHGPPTARTAIG